jgi:hypothetical protein
VSLFRFHSPRVSVNPTLFSSFCKLSAGAVVLSGAIAIAPLTHAAETISLEYGPIQRSLPVKDLKSFAETKKPSGLLADLITFAQQTPEAVHGLLTATVPIKVTTMDRMVNSYIGSVILEQVGKVILPSGRASDPITPLKAALVGAVKNDQFSILGFIDSYPVDIRVNGEQFFAIRKQMDADIKHLPEILTGLQGILTKVVPGFSLNPGSTETTPGTSPAPSPAPSPTVSPVPSPSPAPTDSPAPSPAPTTSPAPSPAPSPTASPSSSITPLPRARTNSEVAPQRTYPLQF